MLLSRRSTVLGLGAALTAPSILRAAETGGRKFYPFCAMVTTLGFKPQSD